MTTPRSGGIRRRAAQLFILDHLCGIGVGVEHYRDEIIKLTSEHGWKHGNDYVPHDAKVKEWGTGRTRVETMAGLGLHPCWCPCATVEDGINAVRRTLPLCVFHPRCEAGGIAALEQYRREWDDEKKVLPSQPPLHDWTSHPADAFRYLAHELQAGAAARHQAARSRQGWVIPPPREQRRGIRL